jgi:hypothetical protein
VHPTTPGARCTPAPGPTRGRTRAHKNADSREETGKDIREIHWSSTPASDPSTDPALVEDFSERPVAGERGLSLCACDRVACSRLACVRVCESSSTRTPDHAPRSSRRAGAHVHASPTQWPPHHLPPSRRQLRSLVLAGPPRQCPVGGEECVMADRESKCAKSKVTSPLRVAQALICAIVFW